MAFPTDTVVGLGCLASSASGVEALFRLKGRDAGKPLILFVDSLDEAARLAGGLAPRVTRLLNHVWPGPLTAVLPLRGAWPQGVGRDGTAGYRIPDHPIARALIRAAGGVLATTSANRSNEPPVARAEDAAGIFGNRVAVIPGSGGGSTPSTVADFMAWPPRVLRAGALSSDRLEALADRADREA